MVEPHRFYDGRGHCQKHSAKPADKVTTKPDE